MACTCAPGKALCRSCLNQTTTPYVGPLETGSGVATIHQVDVYVKQFQDTITSDLETNPLSLAVKRYGTSFYSVVDRINKDFLKRESIISAIPAGSVLEQRLKKGPITPLEFAAFIKNSNYTPATAIVSSNANGPRFLKELDNFYNGDFSTSILGGFCSLFGSVFATVSAFFDLIDSLNALVQDAIAFIEKIKNIENPLLALWEKIKVKALIEAIKKKIISMIKEVILNVCMAISNFDVSAIIGDVPPSPVQRKVVAKVEEKKTALQQVCGDDFAQKIIDKVNALIDYAVGLFENPSVEEIIFLIARFCGFATGLEGLLNRLKDPLTDFSNRYEEVLNTLSNASNRVTGEAIRAGAIRLTETARQEQINTARQVWERAGNIVPSSVDEYRNLPNWDALSSGGDSRLKIQGGWVTRMSKPREGWEVLDIDFRVLIMRLQKEAKNTGIISGHLYLNSGYRDLDYNTRVGGAKASMHLSGLAADLTWDGFRAGSTAASNFVNLARRLGFRGIGLYNSFIHVDVGSERQWDKRS